jgi:hypothetical protein
MRENKPILRDAAKTPLLRMRASLFAIDIEFNTSGFLHASIAPRAALA